MLMTTSDMAVKKIKEFEGLRLTTYQCSAGVLTIGYGHTRGVKKGMKISERQAESLLRGDLLECEKFVNDLHLDLSQGQYDALIDFCFNLGATKLAQSTLLKKIQAKADVDEIKAGFMRWVYAGGKKSKGLEKRRAWEVQRWISA